MGSKVRLLTSKVTPRWKKQLVGARRLEGRKAENDHAVITEFKLGLMRNSRVELCARVNAHYSQHHNLGAGNGVSGPRTDAVGGETKSVVVGIMSFRSLLSPFRKAEQSIAAASPLLLSKLPL